MAKSEDTVDGSQNPANHQGFKDDDYPIIYRVLYTSQVVQDFVHQQYENDEIGGCLTCCFCHLKIKSCLVGWAKCCNFVFRWSQKSTMQWFMSQANTCCVLKFHEAIYKLGCNYYHLLVFHSFSKWEDTFSIPWCSDSEKTMAGGESSLNVYRLCPPPQFWNNFFELPQLIQLIQPSPWPFYQEGMLELFTDIGTILRRKAGFCPSTSGNRCGSRFRFVGSLQEMKPWDPQSLADLRA